MHDLPDSSHIHRLHQPIDTRESRALWSGHLLRIQANQARVGMTLAMPIFHPQRPATVLLRAGTELTEATLAKLPELGVHELSIAYPGLEEIAEYTSEQVIHARASVNQTIADAFEQTRDSADPDLDYRPFQNAIVALLTALQENPHAAQHVQDLHDLAHPLFRSAADNAYISLLIGLKLDFYLEHQRPRLAPAKARNVSSLGVGALLQDIGALALDEEVRERYYESHDEEDPDWRHHVLKGFEMVRGKVDAAAAAVVLHHHQRFDGSGYPARRSNTGIHTPVGTDIHVFARIAAATGFFLALRRPAFPGGRPMPTVRALRLLGESPYADRIDPVALLGLYTVIPPYAPGTIVQLSNAMAGVVTRWYPTEPCRPVVREIQDISNPDLHDLGQEIDLTTTPNIEVLRAEGQDVLADNFYATEDRPFDLHGVARALINRATKDQSQLRDAS